MNIRSTTLICAAFLASATTILGTAAPARAGWVTLAPMPGKEFGGSEESVNGIVYVAGGYIPNSGPLASLQAYDPTTNSWSAAQNMPAALTSTDGAVAINGQLYIAGGQTLAGPVNTLNVYDPASNSWAAKASMPHNSEGGAGGAINGKLYVTTGYDGAPSSALDMYDPATDSWTSLAASHVVHLFPAFGVINGKLYVAGGNDGLGTNTNVTEVYDPATNKWTVLANMPAGVSGAATVALNGRLYAIGGCNPANCSLGTSNIVYSYDFHTNKWKTGTALPAALAFPSAAVAYGLIFVNGGLTPGDAPTTTNERLAIGPSVP